MKHEKSARVVTFGGARVTLPPHWEDVTAQMPGENVPFTLAKVTEDVGALQFSMASYESGKLPNAGVKDLEAFLRDFAVQRELGDPLWTGSHEGDRTKVASAAYRVDGDFTQVWYVSDGKNFALVTYVCDWDQRDVQAVERDEIVKGMLFTPESC